MPNSILYPIIEICLIFLVSLNERKLCFWSYEQSHCFFYFTLLKPDFFLKIRLKMVKVENPSPYVWAENVFLSFHNQPMKKYWQIAPKTNFEKNSKNYFSWFGKSHEPKNCRIFWLQNLFKNILAIIFSPYWYILGKQSSCDAS